MLDDFEDAFGEAYGDVPGTSQVLSAKAYFTGKPREAGGRWYGHADQQGTKLLDLSDHEITPAPEPNRDNTIWDDLTPAIGDVGWVGKGIRLAADRVAAWAGIFVELRGTFFEERMDLTALKAVSFKAKGKGSLWVQFHVHPEGDFVTLGTEVVLGPDWQLYVVRAGDLETPAWYPTVSWEETRSGAVALDFQFNSTDRRVELYLDNVQLHGIDYDAYGFKYDE